MTKKKSIEKSGSSIISVNTTNTTNTATEETTKGRKNKGGKLISKKTFTLANEPMVGNIILHLKCSLQDLEKYNENYNKQLTDPMVYIPVAPPEIQTYETMSNELHYTHIINSPPLHSKGDVGSKNTVFKSTDPSEKKEQVNKLFYSQSSQYNSKENTNYAYLNDIGITPVICSVCSANIAPSNTVLSSTENTQTSTPSGSSVPSSVPSSTPSPATQTVPLSTDMDMATINSKLKTIKSQLVKNKVTEKKAACFWCTYEFENPECYIPTYEVDNTICGYGSFCQPECAVAYLMKETIDDTAKFERYNLLNQIYGKIYNYTKNIKPAPNPFYILEKYYGSLTIKEYRKLSKSNHLLVIVEKPLTRVFPELHEDTDDFMVINSCNSVLNNKDPNETQQYKVKRSNDKKNDKTKTSIIQEHFGLSS